MPYANREAQLAAQRRHYRENKARYAQTRRQRRLGPRSRWPEYAKRLGMTLEEYVRWREGAEDRRATEERERAERRVEREQERRNRTQRQPQTARQPRVTSKQEVTPDEAQALADKQRQMREDYLAHVAAQRAKR